MTYYKNAIFGCLFAIPLAAICLMGYESKKRSQPKQEFQSEFGFEPSSDVQTIRCKVVGVGDTWGSWMMFTLDDATLQRIISKGFTLATPKELLHPETSVWSQDLNGKNPNAPDWWRSPGTNQAAIYYRQPARSNLSNNSYAFIWVDKDNKKVYSKNATWR